MKRVLKKVIVLLTTAILLFSAVGCGESTGNTGNTTYKPGDVINLSGKSPVSSDKTEEKPVYRINLRGQDENTFPIGGFIGPTDMYRGNGYKLPSLITDDVFQKLKDCGVNYIIDTKNDAYSEVGEEVLNFADKYNISYYSLCESVIKIGYYEKNPFVADLNEFTSALRDLMSRHKNFAGFYGMDEPYQCDFPYIKKSLDNLKEAKKAIGASADQIDIYYNLFPRINNLVTREKTTEKINYPYEQYVDDFLKLGPEFLEFDCYPMTGLEGTVTGSWLTYLAYMNDKAIEYNLPWQGYAQAGGNWGTDARVTNENDLNYDVYSMMVFGAKGINYYPGVFPPECVASTLEEDSNDNSLINKYGTTTPIYYYAQKINKNIQAMAPYLLNSSWDGVVDSGNGVCVCTSINPKYKMESYRQLKAVSGDPSLIGCYNYKGATALLVMSNSLTEHRNEITLEFDDNYEYTVIQRGVTNGVIAKSFTLTLEAGEAALVVLK